MSETFAKDAALAKVDRALPRTDRPPLAIVLTRERIDVSVAVWAERVAATEPDSRGGIEEWKTESSKAPVVTTGLGPSVVDGHLIPALYDVLEREADRQKTWAEMTDGHWPGTVELFIAPDVPMHLVLDLAYTAGRAEWTDYVYVVRTTGGLGYLRVSPPKFGGVRGRTPDENECIRGMFVLADPGIRYTGRIITGKVGEQRGGARSFLPQGLPTPRRYDDCFFLPSRDGAAPLAEFTARMSREAWERPLCSGSVMIFGNNREWSDAATVFGVVQGQLGDMVAHIEAGADDETMAELGPCEDAEYLEDDEVSEVITPNGTPDPTP